MSHSNEAVKGWGYEKTGLVNGINVADGWTVILSFTVPSNLNFLLSEIIFSATQQGTMRIKANSDTILYLFIEAYNPINIDKGVPPKISPGTVMTLEYKPNSDGANASGLIGGFKI